MKKHLSLICLLLSLLCILPLNAYAAESKDTTLKYAVGSSYTLTIPDYIEANTDGQSVSVSDAILPWGYALDVTADFDSALKLNDFSDITLSYDLYVNDSKISPNDKVLTQDAGDNGSGSVIVSANVTGVPTYAGTYTATIIFNAELKEVLQTDYTVEEIENDPHLFGIGMTKPEYVVAHFNDDYSSAVITKNGDDSDGRMREFDARKSPFSLNKETLSTVIVKAGVTSIGINAFYECSNLSKVQLPDGLQVIYRDAFYSCTSLENFYLSDDIMKIEEYAFYSCESLTNVKLKLFYKWGIKFNEDKPYTVADNGTRKVEYANKGEIMDGIVEKYHADWLTQEESTESNDSAGGQNHTQQRKLTKKKGKNKMASTTPNRQPKAQNSKREVNQNGQT